MSGPSEAQGRGCLGEYRCGAFQVAASGGGWADRVGRDGLEPPEESLAAPLP